ncbi:MAG: hypothetical protein AAF662_04315 [Pseudomonadota bacterium]
MDKQIIVSADPVTTCLDTATSLIAFNLLTETCPSRNTDEDEIRTKHREFCEAIHGERMEAIGVLLKHRSECVTRLEQREIDSGCFFELELPVDYSDAADAAKIARAIEQVWVQLNRLQVAEGLTSVPKRRPKRSVGRPRPTEAQIKADQKVFEAWETRCYRTYAELALMLDKPVEDVNRALDRHRKRVARAQGKAETSDAEDV